MRSEVEHMKFGNRITEQIGDVSDSRGVLESKDLVAVTDSPEVPLLAKNPFDHRTDTTRGPRQWLRSRARRVLLLRHGTCVSPSVVRYHREELAGTRFSRNPF